jgi:phage shock protein A
LEDPEEMIEQAILDTHESLSRLRWEYAAAVATRKRMTARLAELQTLAVKESRHKISLQPAARTQIKRYNEQARSYEEVAASLREALSELEANVEDHKRKREELLMRKTAAKTRLDINDALAGVTKINGGAGPDNASPFERMEDRVRSLECEAEALAEIRMEMVKWGCEKDFSGLYGDSSK